MVYGYIYVHVCIDIYILYMIISMYTCIHVHACVNIGIRQCVYIYMYYISHNITAMSM